jgi:dihydropteroate synthase
MIARVMGVVNVTPDSFSDGGRYASAEAAVAHGRRLAAQGADWLDVGGESTRPGAADVSPGEELRRVLPVIAGLRGVAPLSIDTRKPEVARAAVAAGAAMWNDISALADPGAPETAAELGCEVVLMHMQGSPATMQHDPRYGDVVAEVEAFLLARVEAAAAAGVAPERIWLDPGIGFGKRLEHNLALMNALGRLGSHGFRVLLGASRKRTIAAIDPAAADPLDRLGGGIALHLHAAAQGVAMVRTHDVRETAQALKVQAALGNASGGADQGEPENSTIR